MYKFSFILGDNTIQTEQEKERKEQEKERKEQENVFKNNALIAVMVKDKFFFSINKYGLKFKDLLEAVYALDMLKQPKENRILFFNDNLEKFWLIDVNLNIYESFVTKTHIAGFEIRCRN